MYYYGVVLSNEDDRRRLAFHSFFNDIPAEKLGSVTLFPSKNPRFFIPKLTKRVRSQKTGLH